MPEVRYLTLGQCARAVCAVEDRGDGGAGNITGYASVFYDGTPATEFGLWADTVERVMPGAFDSALSRPDDARALFNHDPNQVLGRVSADTLSISVDDIGLHYSIVPDDTSVARDVVSHIKRGDIQGSSFAFVVTDQNWRTEDSVDIREIRGVELYDVGPVTFPAYDSTTAKASRAQDGTSDARASWEAWRSKINESQRLVSQRLAAVRSKAARVLG